MTSLPTTFILTFGFFIGCALAQPGRGTLEDVGNARELFHRAEGNSSNTPGQLSRTEVNEIFEDFDENDDLQVQRAEFIHHWTELNLGSTEAAGDLFAHADTNQDGSITSSPDLDRVFEYFDMDKNGLVSEAEFVIIWSSLSS